MAKGSSPAYTMRNEIFDEPTMVQMRRVTLTFLHPMQYVTIGHSCVFWQAEF